MGLRQINGWSDVKPVSMSTIAVAGHVRDGRDQSLLWPFETCGRLIALWINGDPGKQLYRKPLHLAGVEN
ncbi:hypothetical protein Y032_0056g2681 [Ancylostoma ceylanicum]|uniref:Uncharacterized protein n=1 Tax=Ancylostoma ceylanicum TaxID=53326 RepID=A0A016U589_9BILA|nr:hypothetical protein Y032_0056g2681 [Ancylostoma ceylanicum]